MSGGGYQTNETVTKPRGLPPQKIYECKRDEPLQKSRNGREMCDFRVWRHQTNDILTKPHDL